jgi:hypothetical protein
MNRLGLIFLTLSPLLAFAGPAATAPLDVPQLGQLTEALVADVPAGTQGNEGAPGFNAGDAVSVMIRAADKDAPANIKAQKKEIEQLAFKSWTSSKETADGWVLTYLSKGMDMSGQVDTRYSFNVRRTIGGKTYDCYGATKKKADVDANVKICTSLRAKG